MPQDAEQAFEKVFARYGSNGVIERPCPSLVVVRRSKCKLEASCPMCLTSCPGGGLRGLLSCVTNEYIPEEKL